MTYNALSKWLNDMLSENVYRDSIVRVQAAGGLHAKVALVRGHNTLALDGVKSAGEAWHPIPVELTLEPRLHC